MCETNCFYTHVETTEYDEYILYELVCNNCGKVIRSWKKEKENY